MNRNDDDTHVKIERRDAPGLRVQCLRRPEVQEIFLSTDASQGESADALFEKAAGYLRNLEASIVSQEIFGLSNRDGKGTGRLRKAFGEIRWPVTWIEEGAGERDTLFGMQVWAVTGVPVGPVEAAGKVVGAHFEDSFARYIRLGGIAPSSLEASPEKQAIEVFEKMEEVLALHGMNFSRVVRTWFFNRDILSWYRSFNQARDAFFRERGVYDGLVPASTGVGARNDSGAMLAGGLLALSAKDDRVRVDAVPSVMQCPALDYGSSFSRAVEIACPGFRRLLISGTASISPDGETLYVNDPEAQTDLTMEVVHALLASRRMGWEKVTRATVYFKETAHASAFSRWCGRRPMLSLPAVVAKSTICREDLLFEIEVDAVLARA